VVYVRILANVYLGNEIKDEDIKDQKAWKKYLELRNKPQLFPEIDEIRRNHSFLKGLNHGNTN